MEPKLRYTLDKQPLHFSAGAIIKNDKGEYLLIDRLKQPFGFACPAGHIDDGEDATQAIRREVEEETGLKVKSLLIYGTHKFDDEVPQETCSRGVSNHQWTIFAIEAEGELILKADEVKSIGWYSVEQIKKLELESVWKFWFEKLNII